VFDAHYRAGAGILRIFCKAGRGRQNDEQDSQSTKDALRLAAAQPERSYPICVKRMESRTIKTNLLVSVQVEAICRGRIDRPPSA
jgi:hypothetical protein